MEDWQGILIVYWEIRNCESSSNTTWDKVSGSTNSTIVPVRTSLCCSGYRGERTRRDQFECQSEELRQRRNAAGIADAQIQDINASEDDECDI